MPKNPSVTFYWNDYENDESLRLCSLAAQGLWMRCLCIAARSDPTGYVTVNGRPLNGQDLARLTGVSEPEVETLLEELGRNGVYSRDAKQRIYSRRMVRDAKKARTARKNGKKGGNPALRVSRSNKRENPPLDKPPDNVATKPPILQASDLQEKENSKEKTELSELDFDAFWQTYPHPANRGSMVKAQALFATLPAPTRQSIGTHIHQYKAHLEKQNWQQACMASTYLEQERWRSGFETMKPQATTAPVSPERLAEVNAWKRKIGMTVD